MPGRKPRADFPAARAFERYFGFMDRLLVFLAGAGLGAWAGRRFTLPALEGRFSPVSFPAHEASAVNVLARTQSVLKEIRALVVHADVPDAVLEAKIKARIARTIARPDAVQVRVSNGIVSLQGTARKEEIGKLVENLPGLRGVKGVENGLEALTPPFTSWDDAEPVSRPSAPQDRRLLVINVILTAAGIALTYAGHRIRGGSGAGLIAGGAALVGGGVSGLFDSGSHASGFISHISESSSWRPGIKGSNPVASP
jgi:hypothetical protein